MHRADLRTTRVGEVTVTHNAVDFAESNRHPEETLRVINHELARVEARAQDLRAARAAIVQHQKRVLRQLGEDVVYEPLRMVNEPRAAS